MVVQLGGRRFTLPAKASYPLRFARWYIQPVSVVTSAKAVFNVIGTDAISLLVLS